MGKCNKLKRVYYNEYFSLCTTVMAYNNTDLLTLINSSVLKKQYVLHDLPGDWQIK